ncbi:MAG: T9SS type A sorting domain-containing protein [Bacteroidales bacterium]|nr:T9SS type A sorting domain-containing protein [Bacteroidales bacterium]
MRCATCDIAIFDVMGRTVHVEMLRATSLQSHIANRTSHIEMDIFHLPTGIYFLRIQTDNGVVTRKVVKSEL